MRSFASSLAFFCILSAQAQTPAAAPPQTLENVQHFASSLLERVENLSCRQIAPTAGSPQTIVVEMSGERGVNRGTQTSIDTAALMQDVFAISSATTFEWDHWGTLQGKKLAVYRYSNQINGKTHAGFIFADENTGAISRITFRAAGVSSHLFCSSESR